MSALYAEAAGVLEGLFRRSGGLKTLTYADKIKSKRNCFALVCQTLRYKPLLDELIAAVPDLAKHLKKSTKAGKPDKADAKKAKHVTAPSHQALFYIAIYDLLFGKDKKIQGGGFVKKTVLLHANALKSAVVRMKIKAKVKTDEDLLPEENRMTPKLPRYARINTLRATDISDTSDLAIVRSSLGFAADFPVSVDPHVGDILMFPPGTELHTHDSVTSGKLILQDKASCFPAFVLHGERGADDFGDVIDACAAPGNKTGHAAMLVARKQSASVRPIRVFAFDRSSPRLDLLKRRMAAAGADGIVEPCLASFLDVDVHDERYQHVRSILLDPSCSGSGMSNRLDHLLELSAMQQENDVEQEHQVEPNDTAARLQALADFQLEALVKAFSFPQVRRVSYSTCSIFETENEHVVVAALAANPAFKLVKCLPTWPRRGVVVPGLTEQDADCLVRANGLEDGTNGFFVAYFERKGEVHGQEASVKRPREKTQAQKDRKKRKRNKKADNVAAGGGGQVAADDDE
ncbi:hypothetical protein DYB37_005387 [Aphanomyces astaci]|uniref:SAM-dependent MTase RsmB/NOP-type domain-containing protein n=1 Tax=Aphanomyces astaci TaxID=112090 RepID=A0A3R6Z5P0_APHAT|nr:hypothetical protein DYB35_003479 [Aphanomyces astaci]RHZ34395.1 hypothetical protein DYB37_005387 [Aphanomyces astaci]